MDWLTFKFCVLIWVFCISTSKSQSQLLINSTSSLSNQLRSACEDGQPIVPPDECNACICFAGQKYCTNSPCPEQDCVDGVDVPQPDACNNCICRRGKVACSNLICIPAPHCAEKQLYPAQNNCNACRCMNGFITCTANPCAKEPLLITIPTTTTKNRKKKKCIEGESLPGPGQECIECFCQNGRKRCKYVCNPTMESRFREVTKATTKKPNEEKPCIEGESLPGPGLECIECYCQNGRKTCKNVCNPTMESRFGEATTKKPYEEKKCIEGESLPGPGQECIECFCQNGRKRCKIVCNPTMESRFGEGTDVTIATTKKPKKKKKCIEGESLPGPGLECIECFCQNGNESCKNVCNPTVGSRFSEDTDVTKATTKKPNKKKCIEGESLPGRLECSECYCRNGKKMCRKVCNPTLESRFSEVVSLQMSEPECIRGQHIPRPDDCNNCICFEGQIHCTHLPCRMDIRIGPECTDDQPVIRPDECNECYCFEGRLECSDLVCIRGSKCFQGQVIPKPDSCNACKCVEGHILCTDYQCPTHKSRNVFKPGRSSTELKTLDECQEGDIISPPPPPNDCNTCYCMDNRILCTMNSCEGSDSEIKGRLREPNEHTDLEIFDKQISVEPFINMLSTKNEKLPTKLIHTHAYNGFHQEIKVHASHLPKDATKLLKVLATSLDNAALASISQNLLTSSHSLSNVHNSKIPFDNQVVPTKLLGEGNVITTQSNKLITSGSQSNETFFVIPNTEPFDDTNSQSVLPLISKHKTIWKSVSSRASLVFNNNQQIHPRSSQEEINPRSSQEEKLNVYYYDNPPSMFTSIDQNNMIRNPSKFSRPGLPHRVPTKPTRNIVEIPNTNTQSIYPASNPKSININDGKISYVPFTQENNQFKLIPSGLENNKFKPIPSGFVFKRDELPDRFRYQLIKPGHNQVFNYTSPHPIFRPGKFIITPTNNGGKQKSSQSQFIPLSKYYPNHVKPQQIQFKPNQNHLPTLNNKGIQHPPLFSNNPNPLIVAANHYKQPQFGLQPFQGSVSPFNNNGNQTDQPFKAFHPNFQINPPLINLPNQKKRISSPTNEEIPPHSMVLNSTAHHTNNLIPPQIAVDPEHTQRNSSHSLFVSNPSIFYRNEYEVPEIVDVNPEKEQLIPHSKTSSKHTDHYNPPHTSSEPGLDTLIPKVRNKTKKYNTSHSHYEKYSTITYVSEYDPTHPDNSLQIVHDPNQDQNAPLTNLYEYYLPDQESQDLDLTMSKENYYLILPNKYNQHDSLSIKNHQFDTYPHSPSDGNNTDPHSSSQSKFILSRDNSNKKGGLNDPKSAEHPLSLFNSAEDPTRSKSNKHLPPPSQTGPTQNQHPPGVFDDRGSTNGFQYAHNAYENPRQLKPFYKLLSSKLETPQNQLPGFYEERGSADGFFQYPSNSAEDLTHPKVKLNKSPHFDPYTSIVNPEKLKDNLHSPNFQFGPAQKQYKPGVFDNREVKDRFQYAHNADKNPTRLKPLHKLLSFPHSQTPFDSILIQHSPEMSDERKNADGFQHPSNSAENPIHSRGNLHNPKLIKFGPTQNQHLPGMFDDRGSADGFYYPSNSAENPLHPKDKLNKLLHIQFGPTHNQQLPGVFDERGSVNGFQYISSSAENPAHPKENTHKPSNSPFGATTYKQLPGMFDERGSSDGFQYPSNSAESPLHPKENIHISPNSLFGPTTYKHLPGMYSSNSAGNPTHPKNLTHPEQNKQRQSHSQVGPKHNKPIPGMFAGIESPDSFQYSSNSAKNHLHPKENLHYPTQSQNGPPQTEHLPGVFENRGSPGGFQYPSHTVGNPTQVIGNLHKPPPSQLLPSPNQHTPGVFEDRGYPDGFQYPSNSAENPTQNKQRQPNSLFGPNQNQNLPGIFHVRGSSDGFQYPSHSAENPLHPKDNQHNPPHPQFGPLQNQHLLGEFDERGSADAFQYPSNSAENPTHLTQNKQIQPHSLFGPTQNQHLPGMFDERGSADAFQYPSNSAENPTHPTQNKQIQPHSLFGPAQNQHLPGMFDERGSADAFQYPSNSAENPTHPTQNKQIQPHSTFDPAQNQHLPGMFDERGSTDGFQYSSNSVENPTHLKDNLHKFPPHSPLGPTQNQPLPGIFDQHGTADGFQYPSYSAENPLQPKDNQHNPPYSQLGPNQNQHKPGVFDEHGSADGFQYPSNFVENPTHPEDNVHTFPQSQFPPSPNQHTTGVFGDRGSADGFQYPSNSAENPTHPKQYKQIQHKSPFGPAQNQHLPGMFDERGSADGFQYPSNSVENPTHPKENLHKLPHSQFLPFPNRHTPGVFDDRGSADGSHYPSISAEDSTHPKSKPPHSQLGPTQNQYLPGMFNERGSADGFQYPSHSAENPLQPKDNQHNPPHPQFGPNENQHTPGVFDDHGSADGFHYPSSSAEYPTHPINNPNTIPDSKFRQPQNQPNHSFLDDGYNNNNPLRPWMHLDHDQYKPSSFDNLLNGVHNIPWLFSGDPHKDSDTDTQTFAPEPKFTPDYDQYKPSSFDNLINGIHQIPWSVSNEENNALGSDAEITTPRSGFKSKQDQYGPSMVNNPSISNQNENTDLTDVHDNPLQIEKDVSTPSTELTDSDVTQHNLLSKLIPHSDPDSLLPDNGKIPDYYDQLYPIFKAVKKLNDPPIDDSLFSVGSMDQLDLLPFLFPGIAKTLNYEPSYDEDDLSPDENHEVQMINPLSKLKSKFKQLPENNNGILNWLKSKFNKLLPTKDNATVTKHDIDMIKIFNLLSKLTSTKLKYTTVLQNIPFSGFDSEIVENIMNDFKEDTLTTTSTPRTNSTHSYDNRLMSIPTIPEESRPQAPQLKYPDVHIILHQPNDEDDENLPPYIQTDGEFNPATDIDSKDISASKLPKMFNPRYHRPKDQKEECGDGTQWISNCHGCSCYFGHAMCFRLPDCELRPLGEPMTCKPYSHFKMGCYTCECNGDGVSECDATDCNTKPSRKSRVSGATESPLPIFNEFFDSKKTNEILQYYNFYKKLPKDCSKQDLQTQYPTCERGTSWVSSCNKCECNESGKHECIKIDDCELDFDSYGKPGRCKPNSKFYPKTNSMPCVECSCNDEGISYCPTADYRKH